MTMHIMIHQLMNGINEDETLYLVDRNKIPWKLVWFVSCFVNRQQ